jgi:hypothetical protein
LTVFVLSGSAVTAFAANPGELRTFSTDIFVFVGLERVTLQDPLAIIGTLTLNIDPETGAFTGTVDASGENEDNAVLYAVPPTGPLVPVREVTQIPVDGRIAGRAVNIVFRGALGPGHDLYGTGTTSLDPGPRFENDFGRAAGVGVNPETGVSVAWEVEPAPIITTAKLQCYLKCTGQGADFYRIIFCRGACFPN